ncbi:MAG: tetratricopeptide repeat protein [Promethearchaeota archaeon]
MERNIKDFYKSYFLSYWEVKIETLKYQINNFEEFNKSIVDKEEFSEIQNLDLKLRSVINFDIHSLLFQITEALFSTMFALENFDDEYLWFNLSFPKDSSERSFAVYDKISKFQNYYWVEQYLIDIKLVGDQEIPLWEYLFYFHVNLDNYKVDINRNRDNILKLLHKLASIFSDRNDFNAYKHSLRCYPSSLKLTFISERSQKVIDQKFSKYGINFLTKSEINENDESINLTYKSFSPTEDLYHIEKAFHLLSNIIETRRAYYHDIQNFKLYFFEDFKEFFFEDYNLTGSTHTLFKKSDLHIKGYNAYIEENFIEAIKYYKKILQIDKKNSDALFSIAILYMKLENYKQAIIFLRKYLKNSIASQYREGLYYLGGSHYNCGELKEANDVLIRYLKKYQEENDDQVLKALFLLTDIKLKLNDQYYNETGRNNSSFLKSAEKLLLKTEEKEFSHPELWFKLAIIYKYLRRFEKSKDIFKKLHNKFPEDINILHNLSEIYIIEKNFKEAETLIKKALKIDYNNQNTWNLICYLNGEKGDLSELFEACKNSLRLSKTKDQKKFAFNNFGAYNLKKEDYQCALYFFNKALKIDNKFKISIEGKVNALFELKLFDELLDFTKDLEINGKNALLNGFRALAFSEKDDHEMAINLINRILDKIQKNDPFVANLLAMKGEIYKKQHLIIDAIESYQKSLEVERSIIKAEVLSKLQECELELNDDNEEENEI